MKKCPKCSEEIQDQAKKCKHCGADLRNWFVRHKIITVILIIILLGIIGNAMGDDGTNNVSQKDVVSKDKIVNQEIEYIEITAIELSRAYSDNKVSADSKYEDKFIKVNGIINDIGKDILGDPYVSLNGLETELFGIQCMFPKNNENDLIDLSKGQSITLTGKLSGELIGNVLLRNCAIVE